LRGRWPTQTYITQWRHAKMRSGEKFCRIKSVPKRQSRIQKASVELRVGRHFSSLSTLARERKLKFEHGLTLRCGAGRGERELIQNGVCRTFHGIDISENAIVAAREVAKEQSLPLTYEVGRPEFLGVTGKDVRFGCSSDLFPSYPFLERVAEQVWRWLKSDGYLWIHDFIGETQGQYDLKRISIMNQILAILPEKFRKIKKRLCDQVAANTLCVRGPLATFRKCEKPLRCS
jgi:SAM-dependent methyltransferase